MLPALPPRWQISDPDLLSDGIGGKVWKVTLPDGRMAALKQASVLAQKEVPGGNDFLRWIDGAGAIRLLDEDGALSLLEWAGERTLLTHLEDHGDDAATEIAADVVKRLHATRDAAPPATLTSLTENFAGLFAKAQADRIAREHSQFVDAAEIAARLLENQKDVRPLHGDIHHENILSGDRGWLAIDAKGVLGDPAFDIANLFYNPVESELRTDPARAVSMATILSRELACDIEKVLDYAFAFSALSASWHLEDGNTEEAQRSLAVGRAVRAAADQVRS
ncbi:aminoglycoside phosphotransferase family protein [Mesorhizobium sp. CAU 1732]|uniref:aminoglycoside phosphotransferase family protein n=1 Tax=Mesorhizobium sp. CAU 1732 TaxID=3140358 RepID=UPI003261C077